MGLRAWWANRENDEAARRQDRKKEKKA